MSLKRVIKGVLIIFVLTFFMFPVIILVMQSLVPGGRIFSPTIEQFKSFTLNNYNEIFFNPYLIYVSQALRNSLIISAASACLATIIGSIGGYAFARFKFRGDDNLKIWILSFKFFPPIVVVIPLFILYSRLHLYDTYQGMILIYAVFNLPFSIWLMSSFIEDVPREIEESAQIDGCGFFQVFLRVIMPLIKGGLVTTALFNFIFAWNEFLLALCLTQQSAVPMSVGLSTFVAITGVNWGYLAAGSVFMVSPILILSLILQKYIVRGLTFGALKG